MLGVVALLTLAAGSGCGEAESENALTPASTTANLSWRPLGAWSGRGDRQTESFDISSGALRLTWEASSTTSPGAGRLGVTLHSAISGRPLVTIVDIEGTGSDTVRVAAEPRVAHLLIDSDGVEWSVTLEEGYSTPE